MLGNAGTHVAVFARTVQKFIAEGICTELKNIGTALALFWKSQYFSARYENYVVERVVKFNTIFNNVLCYCSFHYRHAK